MTKPNKLFFTMMTLKDFLAVEKNVKRNEPCPCGSGKKFKKCHWLEYEEEKTIRRKQVFK